MRIARFAVLVIFLLLVSAVGANGEVKVIVSIGPQKWLVDTIGGGHVSSQVLVPPGRDPHTFEPTPRKVAAISRSALWLTMEMEFEQHLEGKIRGIAPHLLIVNSTEGIKRMAMSGGHDHDHGSHEAEEGPHTDDHDESHVDHHEDSHTAHHGESHADNDEDHDEHSTGLDPHVWLSPVNLQLMARNITDQLVLLDGEHEAVYRKNLASLKEKLTELDVEVKGKLAEYKGMSFFVYHPNFGYFADHYGLIQEPVEIEGKSPSPRQLSALAEEARKEGVRVIFVQPQFDQKSGSILAKAIGGSVVPVDPLGEDAAANIANIADELVRAFALQRSGK